MTKDNQNNVSAGKFYEKWQFWLAIILLAVYIYIKIRYGAELQQWIEDVLSYSW